MKREHELRHVLDGPEPEERPNPDEGIGLVRFDVDCDDNATQVLERARDVLRVVLSESPVGWPSLEQWRSKLPSWFVDQCAPEETQEEAEQHVRWLRTLSWEERARVAEQEAWTLSNWLYWLEPKQRFWFWWDAVVETPELLRLAVSVTEWPFPWDALKWLFRASGAKRVRAEE